MSIIWQSNCKTKTKTNQKKKPQRGAFSPLLESFYIRDPEHFCCHVDGAPSSRRTEAPCLEALPHVSLHLVPFSRCFLYILKGIFLLVTLGMTVNIFTYNKAVKLSTSLQFYAKTHLLDSSILLLYVVITNYFLHMYN